MSLRDKLIDYIQRHVDGVDVRFITYLAEELVTYSARRRALSYDEIYVVVRDGFVFPIFDDITDIVNDIIALCTEHDESEDTPWVWKEGKNYAYSPDNSLLAASSCHVPGQYTLEDVQSKLVLYQSKVNGTIMCLSFNTLCYLLLIGSTHDEDDEYIVLDLESKDIIYRCNTPVVWNGKSLVDNDGNVHYTGTVETELRE